MNSLGGGSSSVSRTDGILVNLPPLLTSVSCSALDRSSCTRHFHVSYLEVITSSRLSSADLTQD